MSGPRHRVRDRGSLLVVTLWVVTVLSIFAIAVARYLSIELRLSQQRVWREQAIALARGGVYLALQQLVTDGTEGSATYEPYDWLRDDWAAWSDSKDTGVEVVHLPPPATAAPGTESLIEIRITDEERKRDLRAATLQELQQLFQSPELAQAVLSYQDADSDGDAEVPLADPLYYPKNAPLAALEELWDIPGMNAQVYARAQETTFAVPSTTATPTVNINTAGAEVLMAVGLPTLAAGIIHFREAGHYFKSLSPSVETEAPGVPPPFPVDDPEFLNAKDKLSVSSHTFAVEVTSRLGAAAVRHHIQAILRRSTEGITIVSWREG